MTKRKFKIPSYVQHDETKQMINAIIRRMEENGMDITETDFPQLHRMSTSYDIYLTCADTIAIEGPTMKNLKGEMVKRPEVNIMKENWAQFLEIAKEYGLTAKSGKVLKLGDDERDDSPLDQFFSGRKETR